LIVLGSWAFPLLFTQCLFAKRKLDWVPGSFPVLFLLSFLLPLTGSLYLTSAPFSFFFPPFPALLFSRAQQGGFSIPLPPLLSGLSTHSFLFGSRAPLPMSFCYKATSPLRFTSFFFQLTGCVFHGKPTFRFPFSFLGLPFFLVFPILLDLASFHSLCPSPSALSPIAVTKFFLIF